MVVASASTSPTPAPAVVVASVAAVVPAVPVVAVGKRDQWYGKVRDGYASEKKRDILTLSVGNGALCVWEIRHEQLLELWEVDTIFPRCFIYLRTFGISVQSRSIRALIYTNWFLFVNEDLRILWLDLMQAAGLGIKLDQCSILCGVHLLVISPRPSPKGGIHCCVSSRAWNFCWKFRQGIAWHVGIVGFHFVHSNEPRCSIYELFLISSCSCHQHFLNWNQTQMDQRMTKIWKISSDMPRWWLKRLLRPLSSLSHSYQPHVNIASRLLHWLKIVARTFPTSLANCSQKMMPRGSAPWTHRYHHFIIYQHSPQL